MKEKECFKIGNFSYWHNVFKSHLLQNTSKCIDKWKRVTWTPYEFNPFPHTTILQQTTLNIFCKTIENLYNWMDNLWLKVTKSGKHCGKRRNCLFWAIYSFVTMFSKSRLLQRCQKASIWGKGLINRMKILEKSWSPVWPWWKGKKHIS